MVWWFVVAVVVAFVAAVLLTPKPRDAKPAGIDEVRAPTAKLGREIPVLFGKRLILSPNVVWYGDFRARAIKKSSGMFGGKTTVGYRYWLGLHMILCHGAAPGETITLSKIKIGNNYPWTGTSTSGRLSLTGIGDVDFYDGRSTQGRNDYLQRVLGKTSIPAYRGVVSIVARQTYIGQSPYLENWAFELKRINASWQPGLAEIGVNGDMNPVHIIREVLTNTRWGMGYNTTDIDETTFAAAAQTLYTEGFGISLVWDRGTEINDFVPEILRHIDGSIFIDRHTGKFRLKLIRADYDVDLIQVIGEAQIVKMGEFKTKAKSETVNTVSITYHNRDNADTGSVTVQDIALHSKAGATIASTLEYPGITSQGLATKIAWRDLQALSRPFASCQIDATREAASLNPGDPFVLEWPRYEIEQMVMRVVAIEYTGQIVRIEATEDIFGTVYSAFTPSQSSGWAPITSAPIAVTASTLIEAPYHWLYNTKGQAVADAIGTSGEAIVTGGAPAGDATEAGLWEQLGGIYTEAGDIEFCPIAELSAAAGMLDGTLSITAGVDLDLIVAGSWAMIGAEIIRIDTISDSTLTVGRGCLDTVPVEHASGTTIYFASAFYESSGQQHATASTAKIKLLTQTPTGTLDISSAPELSLTLNSRAIRPFPPGRFRINGEVSPATAANDIVLTWNHRSRLAQTSAVLADNEDAVDYGPEAGAVYTISIYRTDTSALLFSTTTVAKTLTVTALDIGYVGEIEIVAGSIRDGYASWQSISRTITYNGETII